MTVLLWEGAFAVLEYHSPLSRTHAQDRNPGDTGVVFMIGKKGVGDTGLSFQCWGNDVGRSGAPEHPGLQKLLQRR